MTINFKINSVEYCLYEIWLTKFVSLNLDHYLCKMKMMHYLLEMLLLTNTIEIACAINCYQRLAHLIQTINLRM